MHGKYVDKLKNKLVSKSGETITEVLVAALVVVLGSILLATMVAASFRMIRNSQKAYDNYLSIQDALAMREDADESAGGVRASGSSEAQDKAIYQADDSGKVSITGDGKISNEIGNNGTIDVIKDEVIEPGESTATVYAYRYKAK